MKSFVIYYEIIQACRGGGYAGVGKSAGYDTLKQARLEAVKLSREDRDMEYRILHVSKRFVNSSINGEMSKYTEEN